MHVDVFHNSEALAALRENWDAVYDADPEAQYFLSFTWIANWLRQINCAWLVLAAKTSAQARTYDAFFPLLLRVERREEGEFCNVLRMGGGWFAGYTGFLCGPDAEERAIPAFSNCILGLNWAQFVIENLYVSPKRRALFLEPFSRAGLITERLIRPDDGDGVDRDIYLCVNLPGDWETFLNRNLSANTRKKARRVMRKLETTADLRVTHASPATFQRDLATLLEFWEAQWADTVAAQHGSRTARGMLNNFRRMLRASFEAHALFLPVLWRDETPLAAIGTLIDAKNRSLLSLVSGRDVTVRDLQTGFILDLHSIRWAIENGFKAYDLLTGDFPYKRSFHPEERRVEWLSVRTEDGRNLGGKLDPRSLPAVLEKAEALERRGAYEAALQAIRQILAADPAHAEARRLLERVENQDAAALKAELNKGLELQRGGRLAEAEEIYRSILVKAPEHFDAAHLLGVVFLQRGQYEAAERQISLALKIEPDMAAAHNNRGNALRSLKRLDEALESFERAIALKPNYPEAFNNRGNALRDLGRFEEALESYDKAIALKPNYPGAINNRANVLRNLEGRAEPSAEAAFALRDYRESDREACLAIFDTNVPKYFAASERQDFAAFLDDLPGPYFVIEDASAVVACGGFARYPSEPDVVALCWGMVAQDRHKKGLGQALLVERLRRLAKTYRGQDVVVYTSQHTAGFFARNGFETARVVRDHFAPGIDLHKMRIRADAARRLF